MKPHNVLMIITDQQRKDSIGSYGNTVTDTPNLDALAKGGIRYERCYVANPICMPNRVSLFTGLYPHNHGMWTNGLNLPAELPTIAGYLSQQGYETANFGKMHFTPYGGDAGNMESINYWKQMGDNFDWNGPFWGFEHVELTLGHTAPLAHYGQWFRRNGGTPGMLELHKISDAKQAGVRDLPKSLHDSTFVGTRTAEFIKSERDKTRPFFIVASFPDPHHPFNPPREVAGKYMDRNIIEPVGSHEDLATRPAHYQKHFDGAWHRQGEQPAEYPGGFSREQRDEIIRNTYAMVDLIDQNVGLMMKTLEQEGLLEDTIVIFTSDHGELLGDQGRWLKGPFFYEGLVNIPLIVYCKGLINAGISQDLVSTVDIFPTICKLLELPIPESSNGQCFKVQSDDITPARENCMLEYRNGYGSDDYSCAVIINKKYKLVVYQDGEAELTDLEKDPMEHHNCVNRPEYADVASKLKVDLLLELLKTGNRFPAQITHA